MPSSHLYHSPPGLHLRCSKMALSPLATWQPERMSPLPCRARGAYNAVCFTFLDSAKNYNM